MRNKRGDTKYYIIISLILGLMVLTISLYWIFNEYFNEGDIEWEVCRQSILVRASLPEAELLGLELDTKGAFPLKCKTEVVTIDSMRTPEEVYGVISDTVAQGWYMFGEGKLDFIHRDTWSSKTVCMAFARVHFSEEAFWDFDSNRDIPAWSKYSAGFGIGLSSYYLSENLENSGGTYNDYLPVYIDGDVSENGNFVIYQDGLRVPPYADPKDYFVVYVVNKRSGFIVGNIFKSKEWEGRKILAIVSVDDLDVLKCDKFLTIPA